MEGGEVIVLARDSGAGSGACMEDFSVYPLRGVHISLDHRHLPIKGIADVGASLGASPLVKVAHSVTA